MGWLGQGPVGRQVGAPLDTRPHKDKKKGETNPTHTAATAAAIQTKGQSGDTGQTDRRINVDMTPGKTQNTVPPKVSSGCVRVNYQSISTAYAPKKALDDSEYYVIPMLIKRQYSRRNAIISAIASQISRHTNQRTTTDESQVIDR